MRDIERERERLGEGKGDDGQDGQETSALNGTRRAFCPTTLYRLCVTRRLEWLDLPGCSWLPLAGSLESERERVAGRETFRWGASARGRSRCVRAVRAVRCRVPCASLQQQQQHTPAAVCVGAHRRRAALNSFPRLSPAPLPQSLPILCLELGGSSPMILIRRTQKDTPNTSPLGPLGARVGRAGRDSICAPMT